MKHKKLTVFGRFKKNIRNKLLTGFLVILPIYVTIFVVKFLFRFIGAKLLPIVNRLVKHDLQLPDTVVNPLLITVGIFLTFALVYFTGLFASNFLGRWIIKLYERIIHSTPVVKSIYSSSKQVASTFSASTSSSFKRVAIVEYPRPGMSVIGFVTGSMTNKRGTSLTSVFIPTTPNPTSGFLVYVKKEDVMDTNMTIEKAIKLVISGGILVPEDLDFDYDFKDNRKENDDAILTTL